MFFNYQQEFLVGLLVPCDLRVIVCCQGKSSLRRVVDRREVSRIRFVVLYSGCSCQSSSSRKFVGTSRRSKTSLERGPTKSETAVTAVIVGSEGFFISNSSTFKFPIFAAMRSRVSLGRPSSKMVRAICETPGVSVEDFSGRTGDLLVDCFEGVGSLVEG